jgi:hypothetical protein
VRRALFSTGKVLSPVTEPKPVLSFNKYPAESQEDLLRTFRKVESPVGAEGPLNPEGDKDFGPPIYPAQDPELRSSQPRPQNQVKGTMEDTWAQEPMGQMPNQNSVYDELGPPDDYSEMANLVSAPTKAEKGQGQETMAVDGGRKRDQGQGQEVTEGPKSCSRVSDEAAETLCKDIQVQEDLEADRNEEFLWVPLQTPLAGYDISIRLERWFQRGCFVWKHKQCGKGPLLQSLLPNIITNDK